MKRVYVDFLQDMLSNAERALEFARGMDYDSFSKDEKSVYAVIRAIEVIGEAAHKVPPEIRKKVPEIPWREIASMRNKLIHEYFGINMQVIWQTIQEDLPVLIPMLRTALKKQTS
jgi:uncharacterized protein with HEPN domain